MPREYEEAIAVIAGGRTLQQDIGLVEFDDGSMLQKRYLANMAGLGYDGLVAKKTNAQKEKGNSGPLSYVYNLFISLFGWHSPEAVITIDEEVITAKVFSLSAGINKFNGNGMMQLPFASPVDGLLDLTIIRHVGKMMVLRSVKKLFDGSFIDLPQVSTHRGQRITVTSKSRKAMALEVDGESIGYTPVTITILPLAASLIVPEAAAQKYGWEQNSKAAEGKR